MKNFSFFACLLFVLVFAQASIAQTALDHYVKADKLEREKKFKEALGEYKQAVAKDGQNASFAYKLGRCHVILKQENEAIAAFEKAVSIISTPSKPDEIENYVNSSRSLGKLYERNKKVDNAVKAYDNAFKFEPDKEKKVLYKVSIVQTLYKHNRFKEAGAHIKEALSIAPNDKLLLYFDGKFQNSTGNYAAAKASLQKGISLLGDAASKAEVAKYHYELGLAMYNLKEYGPMMEVLKKARYGPYTFRAIKLTPHYFYKLAVSYFKVYELEKAKELADKVVAMDPGNSRTHALLGEIAKAQTDKSVIIEHQKSSIETERDPLKRSGKYAELTEMQLQSRQFDDAISSANECLTIRKNDYNVMFLKAVAQFKAGKKTEAVETLKKILTLEGELDSNTKAQYSFALALYYKAQGNKKEALKAFKKANQDSYKYASKEEYDKMTGAVDKDKEL